MAKSLVIVESPAKARTITRYLGRGFQVKASLGHVKDLPKKILAVDVARGFEPTYEVIPGKTKVIADLRKAAEKAEDIYLATDPDREGEAICAHLWEILKNKKKTKFHRVMFNEITKEAIQEAFKHPKKINGHLVDAQQTRRILDRLVGYQVSPLLWEKVRRGISAGRVQTVTLRLIAEREREIQAFKSQEYWTMKASLEGHLPPSFEARATKFQGKALEIPNGASATEHRRALEKADFEIRSVTRKEKRKFPVAPFTTSPLQQEAWRKLHFSAKKTMMFAQRLYEGVELGTEGSVGL
ncbi:MAG: DNA topoisomerase, partial [Acidobacteria bacterium]|nr:DNA topoisomerase [Acidobacteriota bacterium]